jgi:hypothetical protein
MTFTPDTIPTYTYVWADAEQKYLWRTDANGFVTSVPADENNSSYQLFLKSGAEASPYEAPPEREPETTEQKVDHLLADYGLTREEMQAALDVKTPKAAK